jgi:hypothetical protein
MINYFSVITYYFFSFNFLTLVSYSASFLYIYKSLSFKSFIYVVHDASSVLKYPWISHLKYYAFRTLVIHVINLA